MGRKQLVGPATAHIAGELRAQKARRSWTYDDLEERTGLSRSTIDRALKGETAISIEVLIPLAAGMEMDLSALIDQASEIIE